MVDGSGLHTRQLDRQQLRQGARITQQRRKRLRKLLDRQEKEKQALSQIYEKLKVTVEEMKTINERNRGLIQLSLEMIQFDMNLMQAATSGPETGDYNRNGSYSQGSFPAGVSRFDSKS